MELDQGGGLAHPPGLDENSQGYSADYRPFTLTPIALFES